MSFKGTAPSCFTPKGKIFVHPFEFEPSNHHLKKHGNGNKQHKMIPTISEHCSKLENIISSVLTEVTCLCLPAYCDWP